MSGDEPNPPLDQFRFGENWARFADQVDEDRIAEAQASMCRLLDRENLDGLTFLDIGSGSGIHSLAALRLGCARLLAVDVDADSVETTRRMLWRFQPQGAWECRRLNVFDLDEARVGTFDVVYAWGVLHHTGAMREAICRALRCLAPGGLAVFALYRKTRLCGLWEIEKRWYTGAPAWAQRLARGIYIALHWASLVIRGRSVFGYVRDYPRKSRGMDYFRDVHDWLGGYPYESISQVELNSFMYARGFDEVRSFVRPGGLGLLGSGNNEYVFRRLELSQAPPR